MRDERMIETSVLDGATLVRLNRAPVNALDIELNEALAATFGGLAGPVVLTGTGRCFSAGVDLRAILEGGPGVAQLPGRDAGSSVAAGMVDATVEPDELLEVAAARARTLGALSAEAYASTKMQLHRPARTAISNGADGDVHAIESWCSDE